MKFRNIQMSAVSVMFFSWVLKYALHPNHMHMTMLFATIAVAITSELSYRAGKKEKEMAEDKSLT